MHSVCYDFLKFSFERKSDKYQADLQRTASLFTLAFHNAVNHYDVATETSFLKSALG